MDVHVEARRLVGKALGLVDRPDETPCALCAVSRLGHGGPLPDTYSEFVAASNGCGVVCAGCARALGGRPGDEPPPLRTRSFRATAARGVEILDRPRLWGALVDPLGEPHVLSWATGGKRHHWLYAGLSSAARLVIGSDGASIEYVPARDRELLDAVHALLFAPTGVAPLLTREGIRTGVSHPSAVQRFGVALWQKLDAVVARWRPSPLLDLVVSCAPVSTGPREVEEETVIDPVDDQAAEVLALVARSSRYRSEHGKEFWSGFFRHRLERFRRLPLADLVSRLLDACNASPTSDAALALVSRLGAIGVEETASIERALRDRPALLVSLAYERVREAREEKTACA